MIAARVVEMVTDDVVDVARVGSRLVSTARCVSVGHVVLSAGMIRCAACWAVELVFVDVARVQVMKMPVVQIVDVARMHHRGVPTAATMSVGMVGVRATAHASSLSFGSIQF
jgi:hypothetical protein